jgi:hypothetical protein
MSDQYLTTEELAAVYVVVSTLNTPEFKEVVDIVTFDMTVYDQNGDAVGGIEFKPGPGYVFSLEKAE